MLRSPATNSNHHDTHFDTHYSLNKKRALTALKKYGVAAHAINPQAPKSLHAHRFRHSRSMPLYRNGMPLVLLAEWLGHAQISTTLIYYANADMEMKQEAIEKATSKLNPLLSAEAEYLEWEDDEELIRRLYGLEQ